MTAKKRPSKKTAKAPAKRVKVISLTGRMPVLAGQKRSSSIPKGIKVQRNPWVPDDIVILLKFVLTYGAGKYLFELIKLWMHHRNAQKIEIKVGDAELKIEGHISDKALEKKIVCFKELIKGATYEDIEVKLPKGAKRTIPAKLADKKTKAHKDK
jgi:hypothetical protein